MDWDFLSRLNEPLIFPIPPRMFILAVASISNSWALPSKEVDDSIEIDVEGTIRSVVLLAISKVAAFQREEEEMKVLIAGS